MTFGWPFALATLVVVPVLLLGYLWVLRRRRRAAVPYPNLALIRAAAPSRSAWRRHLPFALVLTALGCLALAGARPQLALSIPVSESSIIVALDVSGSMCSTDVDPNRLTAAQTAVRQFVQEQDSGARIGLVLFSGSAQIAVAPTTERADLLKALDELVTGRGTAIGSAILKSVDAIAQINPQVAPVGTLDDTSGGSPGGTAGGPATGAPDGSADGRAEPVPEIVVLLTDGANTRGPLPVDAARRAAAQGVRVYPIGFGTTTPASLSCSAAQLGGSFDPRGLGGGGGFGGGGRRTALVADEASLRQVATITGGQYFSAGDRSQLQHVLTGLPRTVVVQHRLVEVSVALVGAAALLVLLSVWGAARWSSFPR